MDFKNTEYTALKQETNSLVVIENTYIIAMYTITVTIMGFSIDKMNEWLFLLYRKFLLPEES